MKKILVISHEFPPNGGGAGVVIRDLCNELKVNYSIDLVTNDSGAVNESGNYRIIKVKTIPKVRFLSYWMKIRKFDLDNYDSIILNDIGAAMVGAYFFDTKLLEKTIVFFHGSEPERIYINPEVIFRLLRFQKKYENLLKQCYKIVAVSEYMKEKFVSMTNSRKIKSKIEVVYNGINADEFYYNPTDLYEELYIERSNVLLLSVSRIIEEKGYKEKYNIFKKLVLEDEKLHWIIIGEGSYLETLRKDSKKDNINKNISFLGRIDRRLLRKYYSSVDIFWLLSNLEESLGLVYLESQFCNTYVIGRNNAGVKEVIIDKKTGFLVNENNEVYDILKNKVYLNLEKKYLKVIQKKFDIDNNVREISRILDERNNYEKNQ